MNWSQWKQKYHRELEHIAGYEEMFVDIILSRIYTIEPNEVTPQYHFIDGNGKNRYIDFMIIDEAVGYQLAIELDGYSKMVGNGNDYERFNDFLYRQNEIVLNFKSILRFSNKQMLEHPDTVRWQILKTLHAQSLEKVAQEAELKRIHTIHPINQDLVERNLLQAKVLNDLSEEYTQLKRNHRILLLAVWTVLGFFAVMGYAIYMVE